MLKMIGSVLAGSALWAVLWVSSNTMMMSAFPSAFREDGGTTHTGLLAALVALSVLLSFVAGRLTRRVARSFGPVVVLAVLQLSIGLFVQVSSWSLLPVWYHLVFLALLVPATLAGGQRSSTRTTEPSHGSVIQTRPA